MSAQDNARLARDLYDAFGKMDFGRCLAMATDDVAVLLSPAEQRQSSIVPRVIDSIRAASWLLLIRGEGDCAVKSSRH